MDRKKEMRHTTGMSTQKYQKLGLGLAFLIPFGWEE